MSSPVLGTQAGQASSGPCEPSSSWTTKGSTLTSEPAYRALQKTKRSVCQLIYDVDDRSAVRATPAKISGPVEQTSSKYNHPYRITKITEWPHGHKATSHTAPSSGCVRCASRLTCMLYAHTAYAACRTASQPTNA
eukprot:1175862-Prorocentrum_minimum.AAC.3